MTSADETQTEQVYAATDSQHLQLNDAKIGQAKQKTRNILTGNLWR
jgi:hypothetical protein